MEPEVKALSDLSVRTELANDVLHSHATGKLDCDRARRGRIAKQRAMRALLSAALLTYDARRRLFVYVSLAKAVEDTGSDGWMVKQDVVACIDEVRPGYALL